MRWQAKLYLGGVSIVAAGLLLALPFDELRALNSSDWQGLLAFSALGLLAQYFAVGITVVSRQQARSSVIFIPLLACAILFPPWATALVVILVQLYSEAMMPPRLLWRAAFNVSQYLIAYVVAAWIYHTLAALAGHEGGVYILGFGAMAMAALSLNHLIVAGFISLRQETPFPVVLRKTIGPSGANLGYDFLVSPVAIFAALAYTQIGVWGLILFLFPLFLLRLSYLQSTQLVQAIDDLLTVLIKTIEMRDPYTSGHSLRVASLARVIAESIGLKPRAVDRVAQAALLHDVGKVDPVFASLISKAMELTPEEREVIRAHPIKGAELLSALTSVPKDVVAAVRHHHERYDGNGYPDGLAGDSIPLASRIIMMADSVDAMLSDRPYRSALAITAVRAELLRCAGTQFDPSITAIVVKSDTLERAAALASLTDTTIDRTDSAGYLPRAASISSEGA
jgi:putative nucleotidyltransferase with HDIG domain